MSRMRSASSRISIFRLSTLNAAVWERCCSMRPGVQTTMFILVSASCSSLKLLFIACNIAWSAVEHPFFRVFFARWLPYAILPGRKSMSQGILDRLAGSVEKEMKVRVDSRYATGQCDGWKNITKRSLVASIINVEYTVSPKSYLPFIMLTINSHGFSTCLI